MFHRLPTERGEILIAFNVQAQPAAEGVGAGFLVEEAPGLALLGVVALVEIGQQILDGLGLPSSESRA